MLRPCFLFLSTIVIASSLNPLQANELPTERAQPNIILIMADDIAYDNIVATAAPISKRPALMNLPKPASNLTSATPNLFVLRVVSKS